MSEQSMSRYLEYLPALFHEEHFLGRFLLAFEQIFAGVLATPDRVKKKEHTLGFDEVIDCIEMYIAPLGPSNPKITSEPQQQTPTDFLPWLAQWVALSLRDDWLPETRRAFISQIVPLYRQRGTKVGMVKLLRLYTQEEVEIYESAYPAHYFQVEMTLSEHTEENLRFKERVARMIIDQEKPTHTFYALRVRVPTMRIFNHPVGENMGLILGSNTLLGTENK